MIYLILPILSSLLYLIIHVILKKYSSKLKIIDFPNKRKLHQLPIPLSGGISILVPIYLINLFVNTSAPINFILHISILVLILGVADDVLNLSAKFRLFILTIISLIIFVYGISLNEFGDYLFFGNLRLGFFSIFFSILSIIILINAINFIDGIDGLAVALFLQALISLMIFIFINNRYVVDNILLILIMNCILFFLINIQIIKVSKSFLGDSGSMTLGFILACLLIYYSQEPNNYLHPILVIWCIPLLIFDFLATIIFRILKKRNPLNPDRFHIHHQLLQNNNNRMTLIKVLSASIFLNLIGAISFYFLNSFTSLFLLITLFIAYLFFKIKLIKSTANEGQ